MEFKICSLKRAKLIVLRHEKNHKSRRLKFNADPQEKMPKNEKFSQ